ncbi:hypothetical protein [Pandoraea sp.]|uniref:hypothetical protein n=1 Tax=Pandoraea sp. TaxID=1883445 RepID=UPI0012242D58|nr:hypothetical protein [Pandoraea sp.]TAL53175.1 MAG: hypothetical protein EPN80_16340 [Pandoraea sp.]TAM20617.1 MAG: hypothetical protein EPN65_00395 [Pandoraea sp.]
MKKNHRIARSIIAAALAGGALVAAGSSQAYEGPALAVYGQPRLMPVDVSITIGLHGDRYWDGHRYWDRDDWIRHHPHDRDPWRHRRPDHDRGHGYDHGPGHGRGPDRH